MTQKLRTSSAVGIAVLAGAVVSLAGCTAETPEVEPITQSNGAQSATPTAGPDGSEGLPISVDGIPAWAAQAVPQGGDPGFAGGYSGWLSQETGGGMTSFSQSMLPGDYTVTAACNGESFIQLTLSSIDGTELTTQAIDCANATTREFAVTVPVEGLHTDLELKSDPVIYAVAFQKTA